MIALAAPKKSSPKGTSMVQSSNLKIGDGVCAPRTARFPLVWLGANVFKLIICNLIWNIWCKLNFQTMALAFAIFSCLFESIVEIRDYKTSSTGLWTLPPRIWSRRWPGVTRSGRGFDNARAWVGIPVTKGRIFQENLLNEASGSSRVQVTSRWMELFKGTLW